MKWRRSRTTQNRLQASTRRRTLPRRIRYVPAASVGETKPFGVVDRIDNSARMQRPKRARTKLYGDRSSSFDPCVRPIERCHCVVKHLPRLDSLLRLLEDIAPRAQTDLCAITIEAARSFVALCDTLGLGQSTRTVLASESSSSGSPQLRSVESVQACRFVLRPVAYSNNRTGTLKLTAAEAILTHQRIAGTLPDRRK